jgi:hypothetical protein
MDGSRSNLNLLLKSKITEVLMLPISGKKRFIGLKKQGFLVFFAHVHSVAEQHHFYAAPAPGRNFDAAPAPAAPAPTLLYSKAKFLK